MNEPIGENMISETKPSTKPTGRNHALESGANKYTSVNTIEAMADDPVGKRLQAAWMELDVPQCGYCQAGQIMSATDLLSKNPRPSDDDIDGAMSGNVCRCCSYTRIRAAIKKAANLRSAAVE